MKSHENLSLPPLFPLSPLLPSDDVTGVKKLSFPLFLTSKPPFFFFFFMSKWNWLDFEESLWKRRCDQWPGLQIFLAPKLTLWRNKLLCLTPANISGLELSFCVSLGEPLKVSYAGLPDLLERIVLSWKCWPESNTQAYYAKVQIVVQKYFVILVWGWIFQCKDG